MAFFFGVCRVCHEKEHTVTGDLGKRAKIGWLAQYRIVIDLEVPAVDNLAKRRGQGDAGGVWNAVADAEPLRLEFAKFHALTGSDGVELRRVGELVFSQPRPN